jgi:hypothetical protein
MRQDKIVSENVILNTLEDKKKYYRRILTTYCNDKLRIVESFKIYRIK